jgi:RNA polymerase-binding transcription factor DksA
MVAKKSAAKKTTAERSTAKSASTSTARTGTDGTDQTDGTGEPAGETPDPRTPAEKTPAGKPAKSAAKKTAARKPAPGRAPAKKAAPAAEGAAQAAVQTGARTVGAKKTAGGGSTAEGEGIAVATAAAPPEQLAVRPGEDPWTPEEVAEARAGLESEAARLAAEITSSEQALAGLMRDSGAGAGDDDADTGTKNITREHEMSLAANARETLEQTERALQRLVAGTYGVCEVCGKPIGKARMQAFPRATLCVEDKQKQERRG